MIGAFPLFFLLPLIFYQLSHLSILRGISASLSTYIHHFLCLIPSSSSSFTLYTPSVFFPLHFRIHYGDSLIHLYLHSLRVLQIHNNNPASHRTRRRPDIAHDLGYERGHRRAARRAFLFSWVIYPFCLLRFARSFFFFFPWYIFSIPSCHPCSFSRFLCERPGLILRPERVSLSLWQTSNQSQNVVEPIPSHPDASLSHNHLGFLVLASSEESSSPSQANPIVSRSSPSSPVID